MLKGQQWPKLAPILYLYFYLWTALSGTAVRWYVSRPAMHHRRGDNHVPFAVAGGRVERRGAGRQGAPPDGGRPLRGRLHPSEVPRAAADGDAVPRHGACAQPAAAALPTAADGRRPREYTGDTWGTDY